MSQQSEAASTTTGTPSTYEQALPLLEELQAKKEQMAELKEDVVELEMRLDALLPDRTPMLSADGREFWATPVRSTTTKVDLATFAAQRPDLYEMITKPVLDTARFKLVLQKNLIPTDLLAEAVRFEDKRTYITFTEREEVE